MLRACSIGFSRNGHLLPLLVGLASIIHDVRQPFLSNIPRLRILRVPLPSNSVPPLALLQTGRRRVTAQELIAQAEANGYKKGGRKDRDQVKGRKKQVKKTRKDQDATFQRYVP